MTNLRLSGPLQSLEPGLSPNGQGGGSDTFRFPTRHASSRSLRSSHGRQQGLPNDESNAAAAAAAAGARAGEGSAGSENATAAGGGPGSAVVDRAARVAAKKRCGSAGSELSNHYYTPLCGTPAINAESTPSPVFLDHVPTIGKDQDNTADPTAANSSATADLAGPTADQVGGGGHVDDPDPAPPPR